MITLVFKISSVSIGAMTEMEPYLVNSEIDFDRQVIRVQTIRTNYNVIKEIISRYEVLVH